MNLAGDFSTSSSKSIIKMSYHVLDKKSSESYNFRMQSSRAWRMMCLSELWYWSNSRCADSWHPALARSSKTRTGFSWGCEPGEDFFMAVAQNSPSSFPLIISRFPQKSRGEKENFKKKQTP